MTFFSKRFARWLWLFPALCLPVSHPIAQGSLDIPSVRKQIALTFDDGPRPLPTMRLQQLLARHHVHGTFFVVGRMAARYPYLVRSLAADGHEIDGHSWTHVTFQHLSQRRIHWELESTRTLIRELTGRDTRLFRTPGGTEGFLRKRFQVPSPYRLVLWSVHSHDQEGISAEDIVARIERHAHDGSIVLLHNGPLATLEALDCLIPALKARGFEFVTVSQILKTETWERASIVPAVTES